MHKLWTIIVREIREGIPSAVFFLVLFHMVSLTRAVSLGDYTLDALRATTATIAALLVAKSILIVEALPVSRLFANQGLANFLWKTMLFGLVVLVFKFVEELIHSLREYHTFSTAVVQLFQGISWPVFTVVTLWIVAGLMLYIMVTELTAALGPDRTRAVLLGKRTGNQP